MAIPNHVKNVRFVLMVTFVWAELLLQTLPIRLLSMDIFVRLDITVLLVF